MNLISYNTNETIRAAVALRLQFKLGHLVGCLANQDASLLVEAACDVASPTAWTEALTWYGEPPGAFGGIGSPLLSHSTPTGRVNWDFAGPSPEIWIERSKPGAAGRGLPGEKVVSYHVNSGAISISDRAEARHLHEMACLLAGQAAYPGWSTGPDGEETEVTRSGFQGIDDGLAERLRGLAERAERLETLSRMRQELLSIDPMRHPAQFDAALAALAAFEAA